MTKKQKILLGILLPATILGGAGIGYGIYRLSKLRRKITSTPFVPIPIDDRYYLRNSTGYILGFSQNVVQDPFLLTKYNAINLDNQQIDGSARFLPEVFNKWKCENISFAHAKFHFNDRGYSGHNLFDTCDLSSVVALDLSNADFASCILADIKNYSGMVYTASNTFYNSNFANLTSLNLSGTIFAIAGMTTTGEVATACVTFASVNFSSLKTLDLSKAIFGVSNITSNTTDTASFAFGAANFPSLSALSLPPNQPNQNWKVTFQNAKYNPTGGTVHWQNPGDGSTRPANWTIDWFKEWNWVD